MTNAHPSYDLVIGLGSSGMSMARFLNHMGKTVVATDMDASKTEEAKELNALGIKTQIGFHDQSTFNRSETLIPSPGIPITSTHIQTALDLGVTLSSELDIFFEYNTLPVIAITGTNGKTTTTTLIGDMLEACGMNPFVGGNIGTPLVEQLMEQRESKTGNKREIIVAEVSSFQLDISSQFKPEVGVLLNISEDHLDRYNSYRDYEKSKWSLFTRQMPSDTAVINASINECRNASAKLKSKILTFSSQKNTIQGSSAQITADRIEITFNHRQYDIDTKKITQLLGMHNHENIAASVLACLAAGAPMDGIQKGLAQFKNLAHRMAWVNTIDKVSFYNDSKATNTDAVIRAIQCFEKKIILILGGREKGTDFAQLISAVKQKVKTIIALGESKRHIKDTFDAICPVMEATDMKEAVQLSFNQAGENEVVLLSPACASFDMYDSYAHRGNDFIKNVNQIKGR